MTTTVPDTPAAVALEAPPVFHFGGRATEGDASMRNLLGGKGAGLAEMSSLGIPVPPGFTITTEICNAYYALGRIYPDALDAAVRDAVEATEAVTDTRFGDPANPLLLSVRSGARVSMPGMMDTVLNLGLNDETAEGLARRSGSPRFAYDSYRRFVQMYGDVVLGLRPESDTAADPFEALLERKKESRGVELDTELDADALRELVAEFKDAIRSGLGIEFPEDPWEQLWGAIGAVFNSWENPRAAVYREMYGYPASWGTAVNVQAMVFGNLGEDCATGVVFTRDPATGERRLSGEYLLNAQGEDVVAGIRTPQGLSLGDGVVGASLEELMPDAHRELDGGVRPPRAALRRHAGHRVHHPAAQALGAADALGQAHRPRDGEDRRRPRDRGRHR